MIQAEAFLAAAKEARISFFAGVPCSFLTPLINFVIGDPRLQYVAAANEGDAVATASGAWLAGHSTAVLLQNSGLGNAVSPLTSLNFPFRIPTLLIVTWRGRPGLADEPQHELMGQITHNLLELMRVEHAPFPNENEAIVPALVGATRTMSASGLPYAFVMEKGDVADCVLDVKPFAPAPEGERRDLREGGPPPTRFAALERLLSIVSDDAALIASTGKCGRELFTLADRDQHLYQVGSMGCASAMGLGVALHVDRPVVVLDGDGAALMRMGSLATTGAYGPRNLTHVVLDNGTHDSTGGQPTVSPGVDFAAVALGCGYTGVATCDSLAGFQAAIVAASKSPGPHLVHMRIAPGSIAKLGRPTVKPHDIALRFRKFLTGDHFPT